MVILLEAIVGYFIGDYWWLLVGFLLVVIDSYSINGYCGYFVNGYWWLLMVFYCKPLVVILLVTIDGYSIGDNL
jgi:hypothetical protein